MCRWDVKPYHTCHQTHYRSNRGRVFTGQITKLIVLKHWRKTGPKDYASISPGPSNHAHNNTTNMQYEKNTKYTKMNTNKFTRIEIGWVWWKPNLANCKNCSSKCAYDCAQLQYTIQYRTVLIISPPHPPLPPICEVNSAEHRQPL